MAEYISLYNETAIDSDNVNSSTVTTNDLYVDNIYENTLGNDIIFHNTIQSNDILPTVTSTYNLGSSSKRFNTFYITSIDTDYVSVLGVLDKLSPTLYKILMDSTNNRIRYILNGGDYIDMSSDGTFGSKISVNYITSNTGSGTYIDQLYSNNILPQLDASYDIGSSSYKYVNIYSSNFIGNTGNITTINSTNGNITTLKLGTSTGILHSDSSGNITSSAVNLANSDVTGILPNSKTTGNTGNSVNTLVMRDSTGNFSNNIITTIRLYCGRLFTDSSLATGFVLNLTDAYMNLNSVQILKMDTLFTIRLSTVPAVNNTYDLGSTGLYWKSVYTTGMTATNITATNITATNITGSLTGPASQITLTSTVSNIDYYLIFSNVPTGSGTIYTSPFIVYNPVSHQLYVYSLSTNRVNTTQGSSGAGYNYIPYLSNYVTSTEQIMYTSQNLKYDNSNGKLYLGYTQAYNDNSVVAATTAYVDKFSMFSISLQWNLIGGVIVGAWNTGMYWTTACTTVNLTSTATVNFTVPSSGVFRIDYCAMLNGNCGKIETHLTGVGDVTLATTDLYQAASGVTSIAHTNVSLTGGVNYGIYFKSNGKNASSSGYYFFGIYQSINIIRVS